MKSTNNKNKFKLGDLVMLKGSWGDNYAIIVLDSEAKRRDPHWPGALFVRGFYTSNVEDDMFGMDKFNIDDLKKIK